VILSEKVEFSVKVEGSFVFMEWRNSIDFVVKRWQSWKWATRTGNLVGPFLAECVSFAMEVDFLP